MAGTPPVLPDDADAPLAPWLADSDEPWDEIVLRRRVARWLIGEASPDDWHCYARECAVRAAHRPLHWIIRQAGCDRATAQLIFFRVNFTLLLRYRDDRELAWAVEEVPEAYDLLAELLRRLRAGFYTRTELAHDPGFHADWQGRLEAEYGADTLDAFVAASLRTPMPGRKPACRAGQGGIPQELWDETGADRYTDAGFEGPDPHRRGDVPPPWPPDARAAMLAMATDTDPEVQLGAEFAKWLMSDDATPDDWHRHASGANWDQGHEALHWIIQQPQCDKATALRIFWAAQPAFYLAQRGDRARAWQWESEPEIFDMVIDIRERFLAGFYTRSELAFLFRDDPLTGDCLTNFDAPAAERKYGAAIVEAWLPASMQVSLPGREIDDEGWIEGIPARFWPEDLR